MRAAPTLAEAQELLAREAHYLDAQRWDDWLALYCEDASFWMPAWKDTHALTDSPESELSLIYYAARAGLEDRVWRLRSGLSVASLVLPRTAHLVANVILAGGPAQAEQAVHATWTCHVYDPKRAMQHAYFGRYEHRLRRVGSDVRIAAKKVVLMNDRIATMLDFYCI